MTPSALVLALVLASEPAAPASPFRDMPHAEALQRAEAEGKLLVIDFFATWCKPCHVMEQTTHRDPAVVAWLRENAVALRVDAEKQAALARRHGVSGYPTHVVTDARGEVLGRLVGFRDAARFLAELRAIRGGGDSVPELRQSILNGRSDDPGARYELARALAQLGRHAEALAELEWCHDHGVSEDPGFLQVRRGRLLRDWMQLAERHAPARASLQARREKTADRLVAGGDRAAALDYVALASALGEAGPVARTLERLRVAGPEVAPLRQLVARRTLELLAEGGEHAALVEALGDPKAFLDEELGYVFNAVEQVQAQASPPAAVLDQFLQQQRARLFARAELFVQSLESAGEADGARAVREWLEVVRQPAEGE